MAVDINDIEYVDILYHGEYKDFEGFYYHKYWKSHKTEFFFHQNQIIYPNEIEVDGELWAKYPLFAEGIMQSDSFLTLCSWNGIDRTESFLIKNVENDYGLFSYVIYPKNKNENSEPRFERVRFFKFDIPNDSKGNGGGTMLILNYVMCGDVPTKQLDFNSDDFDGCKGFKISDFHV